MTPRRSRARAPSAATSGFLHDDPEFAALLRVAAARAGLDADFVEKDYWVTHVLWWLRHEQFGVCFKGGTSLSKCFGLIHRFSEDIDVHLVPPTIVSVPAVESWTPSDTVHSGNRLAYFKCLEREFGRIPGIAGVRHDVSRHAPRHINAIYYLEYDSRFEDTVALLHRSVQLEIAPDTVFATVFRPAAALVHDALSSEQLSGYINNRPEKLNCAHPVATLLGKLDAICNQHARASDPSRYVRHFEDAHHIINAIPSLPPLPDGMSVQALAAHMRADKQIRRSYNEEDPAFTLRDPLGRATLEVAHSALHAWHWGPRVSLLNACTTIRDWLAHEKLFATV
jgi:Nucleotidyl transferase AbiEii toxin, Type IV TA system